MGFFGLTPSADEKRKEEVRTGARAPDRTERKQCWDARDGFYRCLDKNNVVDSLSADGKKIADKQCATEHKAFEDNCASAWVRLFFSLLLLLPLSCRSLSLLVVYVANLFPPKVTYFKRYRVAEHKKRTTLERLEKEGANRVAVEGAGDLLAKKS